MKKFSVILIMLTLVASMLAACGQSSTGGNNPTDPSKAPSNTADNGGSKGKKTVHFWHSLGGGNGERIDEMIKRFNDSQDKIEVVGTFQGNYKETVTKLQQAIAAKSAPEVAMIERAYIQMFSDSDVLEDLTPYVAKTNLDLNDFSEGLMGHSNFNDKLVSLPLNRSTPILHVNKTMLDELNLAIPTTWEEMADVASKLAIKEGNEYKRYGLSMPYDTWYPMAMITQAGGRFFNEEGTGLGFIDNGIGVKVFEELKKLQSNGGLYYPPATDSGNIVGSMFKEGKVGMLYQSTGTIGGFLSSVEFEYVTAFLPKEQVHANPTGGANVSMLNSGTNKDEAWEFINWMMTNEQGALQFIIDTGYLPFTKSMTESKAIQDLWAKEPIRKTAYEQLQYAIDTNKAVAWTEVEQEFFSAIEAIMYDSKDIAATLDTLKKNTDRSFK
ncbi:MULTISPECIES: ABC transporter substrate-binding protein [unclassified Paenibacillus]|uniref:ABC transporter substrate-binding protein n=1 Tax=unclassified Paenibacillus TaxID=185978 RepID=UPI002F3F8943